LTYAPWPVRVLAAVVDRLIPLLIVIVGGWAQYATRVANCLSMDQTYSLGPYCATGNSVLGVALWVLALLAALGFIVWNEGYLQGRSGASIGKRILGIRLIGENTGQPVGFGTAVLRQVAHVADAAFCFVGYLFPLWDAKKRTLADKITRTVCIRPVAGTSVGDDSGIG